MCGIGTRMVCSELNDHVSNKNSEWSKLVGQAFGDAVDSYDANAPNQRQCAEAMVERVLEKVRSDEIENGFEIGCGTGFLTRLMLQKFSSAQWLISDISSQMVQHCRSRLEQTKIEPRKVEFVVANGEHLDSEVIGDRKFDLICSNLAFQWFENLEESLSRMVERLRPGGWLFFSTLGPENLGELRFEFPCLKTTLHEGTSPVELDQILSPFGRCEFSTLRADSTFEDLGEFLNSMKLVGASTARRNVQLTTSELRSAIRRSKASNQQVVAGYQFLIVEFQKL